MAAYVVNGSYTCICFFCKYSTLLRLLKEIQQNLAVVGESQKGIMLCPKEEQIKDGETALSLLQKVMGTK